MLLNFDIIAIVIIVFSVIFAYARGFYKQLKITLAILVPFAIIIFAKSLVSMLTNQLSFMDGILDKVANIFAYFTNITTNDLKLIIIYLVIFLIAGFAVHLLVGLVSPSKQKKIITFKTKSSKYIAAGLGIFRAAALILIALFLLKEIAIINYNTPMTKMIINLLTPILPDIGG